MDLPWWAGPGQLPIPVRFEPPAGSVHAEHAAALRREWQQQDVEAREHAERHDDSMTRPWLTLPPLLADYARTARLLHLTTAELRSMHEPPPQELRCWRTTEEGRLWQAEVQALVERQEEAHRG